MKHQNIVIANHYAKALFELIANSNNGNFNNELKLMESELSLLSETVSGNDNLLVFIKHPCIQTVKKVEFMENIFKKVISPLALNLLLLLTKEHMVDLIELIHYEFKTMLDVQHNILKAKLTMAYQAPESMQNNLKARMKENLGQNFELEMVVDKSIIGGLVLQLGDFVIDGSVKQKLNNIKKSLLRV